MRDIVLDVEERTTPAIYRGVRDGLADVGIASEFASHGLRRGEDFIRSTEPRMQRDKPGNAAWIKMLG